MFPFPASILYSVPRLDVGRTRHVVFCWIRGCGSDLFGRIPWTPFTRSKVDTWQQHSKTFTSPTPRTARRRISAAFNGGDGQRALGGGNSASPTVRGIGAHTILDYTGLCTPGNHEFVRMWPNQRYAVCIWMLSTSPGTIAGSADVDRAFETLVCLVHAPGGGAVRPSGCRSKAGFAKSSRRGDC